MIFRIAFSGRIVMGLFGKTVPKTVGKDQNSYSGSPLCRTFCPGTFPTQLLIICFMCFTENFRALCTGNQVTFSFVIFSFQ